MSHVYVPQVSGSPETLETRTAEKGEQGTRPPRDYAK
jgi:hypothetical protein